MRVGLIHAIEGARTATSPRLKEAGFAVFNLLDEALLPMAEQRGGVDEECKQRMALLVQLAGQAGAEVVVTTCNAYSAAVREIARNFPELPVMSIDEELIQHAILAGPRIGLIGTVAVGLRRQQLAFEEAAVRLGRQVDLTPHLVPEALDFLRAGDLARHDRALAEVAETLVDVDVIVLAQASMASAADLMAERGRASAPVLASPQLLVASLRGRQARSS